jgi:D-amino-acid dehydrogenase
VEGIERDGTRVAAVRGAAGRIEADEVVLALGAWSPALARQLDLRLPIQPGKGYSITYARPTLCPVLPLVLRERSVCVTAWPSGYRLGSTMEFSGYDTTLNRTRLDALRRGAAEYLREPEGPAVLEEWYGWRPMSYDDLPLIGRAPNWRNLTLATGHGMLGVSMSATTGILVADLLAARAPAIDPAPYLPQRLDL